MEDFHPGIPPSDPCQKALGLMEAIEATKSRIEEYKSAGADTRDLTTHLISLEKQLRESEEEKEKVA